MSSWASIKEGGMANSLSSRLMNTLRSYVPKFDDLTSYGPTLDATVIETLQILDNSNSRESSGAKMKLSPQNSSSSSSVANGFTPTARSFFRNTSNPTAVETASAMSLLNGTFKTSSQDLNCSPSSQSRVAKGSGSGEHYLKTPIREESVKEVVNAPVEVRPKDLVEAPMEEVTVDEAGDGVIEAQLSHHEFQEKKPPGPFSQRNKRRYSQDNSVKKKKPKKLRTLWAVTRINIFDDCSKTYEIMGTTPFGPANIPDELDGIFVIGAPNECK